MVLHSMSGTGGTGKSLGGKFRETLLAHGGSMEPIKVFKEFMGREPSTEALLRHNNLL